MSGPPGPFVTRAMDVVMVRVANWDRKFVGDLERHATGLREAQMMGLSGPASADQTGLTGDERQVVAIADPFVFRDQIRFRRIRTDVCDRLSGL